MNATVTREEKVRATRLGTVRVTNQQLSRKNGCKTSGISEKSVLTWLSSRSLDRSKTCARGSIDSQYSCVVVERFRNEMVRNRTNYLE